MKTAAIWVGFAPGMRVLWACKLERYHDLMSFRRCRFLFSYVFFLQRPSLCLLLEPERRTCDGVYNIESHSNPISLR
jgi:hypothetical protein